MNTVCIDTSSESIAITAAGKLGLFTCIYKPANKRHSALLISSIEYAVKEAGFDIDQTEIIVCSQGPGGFTGLRLAYSAAKAIHLKTNAKMYCIPILDAIHFNVGKNFPQSISIIDAKRDRFYTKLFNDGICSEAADIPAVKALELADLSKICAVCGFGTDKFRTDLLDSGHIHVDNLVFIELKPEILSQIMLEYICSTEKRIEIKDYDGPMYIRKSDAEE